MQALLATDHLAARRRGLAEKVDGKVGDGTAIHSLRYPAQHQQPLVGRPLDPAADIAYR